MQDALVARARAGDRDAVEELLVASQDLVYRLALRMMGDPADAEDVTQEILLRVAGGLASFRGDSSYRTWLYRVASNHLLTARKRRAEQRFESFEAMGAKLDEGVASDAPPVDDQMLLVEAKLRCTSTMLLCLDREHRLAYVLGEILELSSEEGASVLEITADAFRKRLSRARERMTSFMGRHCGLVDERLACRCAKQAACSAAAGDLARENALLARHRTRGADGARETQAAWAAKERVDDIDALERAVSIFRSHPAYAAPPSIVESVRRALDGAKSELVKP